jgi:filamentous hemagglutinin family protein
MLIKKVAFKIGIVGQVSCWWLAMTILAQAQISSDRTLPTKVTTSDGVNFRITNGHRTGSNLFYSFREFSVPTNGSAVFNNGKDVQNIISRVTGSSVSNIDGLLKTQGNANLFLLNPNGIIFGSNASLNIGGSFLASTADSLIFADGSQFSAVKPQASSLLTVSVPIGLQFGSNPGEITNKSPFSFDPNTGVTTSFGLRAALEETLAFVGGRINFLGGNVTAEKGRVEIGSVAGNEFVKINPNWTLNYQGVNNFDNIQLRESSTIEVSEGKRAGEIHLRGKQIQIADGSSLITYNSGNKEGGILSLEASESVEVIDGSQILADRNDVNVMSPGLVSSSERPRNKDSGVNISISTNRLIVRNFSFISARNFSEQSGSNITINASESVNVSGGKLFSSINTQTFRNGDAGEIKINTGRLILQNGGRITSSSQLEKFLSGNESQITGDGGRVIVNAASVEARGLGIDDEDGSFVSSGLFAQSEKVGNTGNAGRLEVNTQRLVVRDGATISAGAIDGSQGRGGELDINASDSVEVVGSGKDENGRVIPSQVIAESEGSGNAGNLNLATGLLTIRDGAEVSVSSPNAQAGNLTIAANTIYLDRGFLSAQTSLSRANQTGANINLQGLNLLLLDNGSTISAAATGNAKGGNIIIDAADGFVIATSNENNDIIASATQGAGGNIDITAQSLFNLEEGTGDLTNNLTNDINASSQFDIDGEIIINDPDIDPEEGLENLPENLVDVSRLVSQNLCQASKGSKFVVTGRGGLPESPNQALSASNSWEDWRMTSQNTNAREVSSVLPKPTQKIVEAQGLAIDSRGNPVLTAESTAVTPHAPGWTQAGCQ